MSDLTEFLLACIAEDEATAQSATDDGHKWLVQEEAIELFPEREDDGTMFFPRKAHASHVVAWQPQRVLRECEAKRRIIRNARAAIRASDLTPGDPDLERDYKGRIHGIALAYEEVLAAMVTSYADRPGYDPEWAE